MSRVVAAVAARLTLRSFSAKAAQEQERTSGQTSSQEPGAALMAELGGIPDAETRRALLREKFQECDDSAMQYLAAKLQVGRCTKANDRVIGK